MEFSPLKYNQYAITWGAQNFRDALAKKQSKYMNLDLEHRCHLWKYRSYDGSHDECL